MRTQQQDATLEGERHPSPHTESPGVLTLDVPASRTVRSQFFNKLCSINILLQQHERTKESRNSSIFPSYGKDNFADQRILG